MLQGRLNHQTTYNLIASHGLVDEMLYFAKLVGDFERVITHHIQAGQYLQALATVRQQPRVEIYYRFSPVLMEKVPYETVTAWIAEKALEPKQLIPSIMKYDSARITRIQDVRFSDLRLWATRGSGRGLMIGAACACPRNGAEPSGPVLAVLCPHPEERGPGDPQPLAIALRAADRRRPASAVPAGRGTVTAHIDSFRRSKKLTAWPPTPHPPTPPTHRFFRANSRARYPLQRRYFDLQYALRLCTQHGKAQACILIYSAMGLYEEAVELALKVRFPDGHRRRKE